MDENIQPEQDASSRKKLSRLSFPFNSSSKENGFQVPNRRHTLVPNRSILKPNLEGSNTINLISDTILKERRRVSFAPEVTLHKIDYSRSNEERKLRKRNSFGGQIQSQAAKLNTSQYIWKSYQAVDNSKVENDVLAENGRDEVHSFTSDTPHKFIIDEDSTTQTMELSAELTQEIIKNHNLIKEQYLKAEGTAAEPDLLRSQNSLQDVFEEAEEEINSDKLGTTNEDESEMEFTETFKKIVPNVDPNNITEISMDLTQPANFQEVQETFFHPGESINTDDDNDTMEFTQPVAKPPVETIPLETSLMELTETLPNHLKAEIALANEHDETMEFTQPVSQASSVQDNETGSFETDKLSIVLEMSEPPTSDQPEVHTHDLPGTEHDGVQITPPPTVGSPSVHDTVRQAENIQDGEKQFPDSSIIENRDISSDMETSLIATEMIPLAEVTADFTENVDEYDSDNSLVDDNHVNVSLDVFLRDANVQFYDNIGPSNAEINQTLIFSSDAKSSPFSESSPTNSSATSSTSTPSNMSTTKRANLIEYIDACTNIPYYHYIVHLINQYQSSIQSIATMVNTFSNDVLESNPTAIREYYQQTEEIKTDLCTNYQAIATFTRKQAKCQNLRFLSGLLEQLISSYERANQFLESELAKALDWRRGVLIKRQKMIERKVELNQYIQKLDALRDNWNSINVDRIKKVNENLRMHGSKKAEIKQKISDQSKLVSSKTKSLTDKRNVKEELLKEVERLRKQVTSSTVPSENDLSLLNSQFFSLEKSKSIKLVPGPEITLVIAGRLKAIFMKAGKNNYDVKLGIIEIQSFAPFSQLVQAFIEKQQRVIEREHTVDTVKQLVRSWNLMLNIWKELITINFIYSSYISDAHFRFQFSLVSDAQLSPRKTFLIEGSLDELFEPGKSVKIKLAKQDLLDGNSQVDQVGVLEQLRKIFDNKNSIINRFVLA